MRVSAHVHHGLRLLLDIATSETESHVSVKEMSARQDVTVAFANQICHRLRKSGILESKRGAGGGFALRRDPSEVTLLNIFEAVGEDVCTAPCTNERKEDCPRADTCIAFGYWTEAAQEMRDYLSGVTLEDVLAPSKKQNN